MEDPALHDRFVPTEPGSLQLAAGELHVWAVPLTGDPARFAEVLSEDEHKRVQRFRFADHQRRYQIGHGALRKILAGYLGRPAEQLAFRQGDRGKPFLADDGPFFNLSHSGKLALIAVAPVELGVDVEKVRHLESLMKIAERHFSPHEFECLSQLDGEQRELAFYRCWTRKEGYIKALGEGLSMQLDSFDVSIDGEPRLRACHSGDEDPADWTLLDVSPGPEYVGAVAMRAGKPLIGNYLFT